MAVCAVALVGVGGAFWVAGVAIEVFAKGKRGDGAQFVVRAVGVGAFAALEPRLFARWRGYDCPYHIVAGGDYVAFVMGAGRGLAVSLH